MGGFTFWVYRRTVPPVSPFFRLFLSFLRMSVFVLSVLAIFGTVLTWTTQNIKKPVVGILIDTSQSMNVMENQMTRGQELEQLIGSPLLKELANKALLRFYSFSDNLIAFESLPDSISFKGTATDLTQALKGIQSQDNITDITACFLFSDGRYNSGENPVRVCKTLDYPVYTITLGTQQEKKDLLLAQIIANEVTYVDNQIPVELFIRGPGYEGENISVRLRKEQKIIDEQSIVVPSNGFETSLKLFLTPQEPGFQKYSADISRLGGEFTYENNQQEFYVQVIKNKLNILVLAGFPSPDLAFLKRILLDDKNLIPIVRTWESEDNFYEGSFPSETEIEKTDLVILLDFPHSLIPMPVWEKIADGLIRYKKPLFLIAGKHMDFQKLNDLEAMLPINLPQKTTERLVIPKLTARGKIHPVLRTIDNQDENLQAWTELPPIYSCWSNITPKSRSELLMTGIAEKTINLSFVEEIPLLFARRIGEFKSLIFLGHGLYRWDLLMWNIGSTNEVLKRWINNTVRWLVATEDEKLVRFSTNKPIYRSGEEIFLSAQIYDEMFRPVERATVKAVLNSPSSQQTLQLADMGGGQYRKTFRLFESGVYTIQGEAALESRLLDRDQLEFSVSSYNPEFENTTANPDLMENIAQITGGQSGFPDSLASFIHTIQFTPQTVYMTKEIKLYNLPLNLILIILLLSLEWLIRKRKGML